MTSNKIANYKGIGFKGEKNLYSAPSWEEMGKHCFSLAQQINSQKIVFDRLVTMAKGGWTWARTMADLLAIDKVASIQVKLYQDFTKKKKEPALVQALPVSVKGEKILVFDDVADTGDTLKFCQQYLKKAGSKDIKIATLFYKPWSQVKPDFYSCQTKSWIIFPHELRESVSCIGGPWLKKGISKPQVVKRLVKIGLPKKEVEYYMKLEFGK
jgi:hypoxanthine phosphoribosyltransferase